MDELNINPVDAGQGGDVDANLETNVDTANNDPDGGSDPINNDSQSNVKPVQDKETNHAFAEMRRAREQAEKIAQQKEKDWNISKTYGAEWGIHSEADIANMYGQSHGITTFEQFEQALKMQAEAERMNVDPALYTEVQQSKQQAKEALEKLSKYERREMLEQQAQEIEKDTKWGSFFSSNKDEIMKYANDYNVDLQTAKLLVLEQKYEQPNVEEIKQQAVKEYIEKVKSGNVPVEGSGNTTIVAPSKPKTWEEARKQAMSLFQTNKQK